MPFGQYKDFKDCVNKNQNKENPEGYCSIIHKKTTGKYPNQERLNNLRESLKEVRNPKDYPQDVWNKAQGMTVTDSDKFLDEYDKKNKKERIYKEKLVKQNWLGRFQVYDTETKEVVFSSPAEYEVDDYLKNKKEAFETDFKVGDRVRVSHNNPVKTGKIISWDWANKAKTHKSGRVQLDDGTIVIQTDKMLSKESLKEGFKVGDTVLAFIGDEIGTVAKIKSINGNKYVVQTPSGKNYTLDEKNIGYFIRNKKEGVKIKKLNKDRDYDYLMVDKDEVEDYLADGWQLDESYKKNKKEAKDFTGTTISLGKRAKMLAPDTGSAGLVDKDGIIKSVSGNKVTIKCDDGTYTVDSDEILMESLKEAVNPDIQKSIDFAKNMRKKIMQKYGVDEKKASQLIDRASEYNPKDEKDSWKIIDNLVKSRLESYKKEAANIQSFKKGDKVKWHLSHGEQTDVVEDVGFNNDRGRHFIKLRGFIWYQSDIDRVNLKKESSREDSIESIIYTAVQYIKKGKTLSQVIKIMSLRKDDISSLKDYLSSENIPFKESLRKIQGPKPTINTASGEARYLGTEFENEDGKWNDSYAIKDGFWVIHQGKQHHVYKVNKKEKLNKLYESYKEGYQGILPSIKKGTIIKDVNGTKAQNLWDEYKKQNNIQKDYEVDDHSFLVWASKKGYKIIQ